MPTKERFKNFVRRNQFGLGMVAGGTATLIGAVIGIKLGLKNQPPEEFKLLFHPDEAKRLVFDILSAEKAATQLAE